MPRDNSWRRNGGPRHTWKQDDLVWKPPNDLSHSSKQPSFKRYSFAFLVCCFSMFFMYSNPQRKHHPFGGSHPLFQQHFFENRVPLNPMIQHFPQPNGHCICVVSPIFRPIPGIPGNEIPLPDLKVYWSVLKGARENRRRDDQSLIIVALHNGSLDPLHQDLTTSVMTVVEIRQEKIHGRRIQTSRPVEETEGKKNRDDFFVAMCGQICRLFRNQQEFPQLKYHPSIIWIPYSLVIKHGSNMDQTWRAGKYPRN